jgi:hypothetical protein
VEEMARNGREEAGWDIRGKTGETGGVRSIPDSRSSLERRKAGDLGL